MTGIYGPNTAQVEAFLALLPSLTAKQWEAARDAINARWNALRDAWDAAYDAAWDAAADAAHDAAWDAARDAARAPVASVGAARAAVALAARDLISREHFDILTAPMRAAGIDFNNLIPAQTPAPDQAPSFSSASGAGSQQVDRENQAPPAPGVDPAGTPAPSAPVQRSLTPGTPSPTPSLHSLGVGDGTQGETVKCVHCGFAVTAPSFIEAHGRMSSHYDVEHRYTVDDARWVG